MLKQKRELNNVNSLSLRMCYVKYTKIGYGVGDAGSCGVSGCGCTGAGRLEKSGWPGCTCSSSRCTADRRPSVPVGTNIVAINESTSTATASDHVAFSRKSAVWRTPKAVLPAAKLAASPPPFEFCTNTTSVSKILAKTNNMAIIVYIVYYLWCFFNSLIWAAK